MKVARYISLGTTLGVTLIGLAPHVKAQESQQTVLEERLKALEEELKIIKRQREVDQEKAAADGAKDAQLAKAVDDLKKIKKPSWLDSLTLYGDLRLRSEFTDYGTFPDPYPSSPSSAGKDAQPDRWRFRLRARVGADWALQDWANVGFRISSGEQEANKGLGLQSTSGNQTLGDTFSRKPVAIDLAYVTVHPPALDWLKVTGGKMLWQSWEPNFVSAMVQRSEVNPEGLAETLEYKFGDREQFRTFFSAGQYTVNEFSKDANDAYLFDQQIGLETKINDRLKLTIAGGYYGTKNLGLVTVPSSASNLGNATRTVTTPAKTVKVVTPPKTPGGATGTATITTSAAASTDYYLDDFGVFYGRSELVWTVGKKPFLGTPNQITISGEILKNGNSAYDSLTGANTNVDDSQTFGWTGQIAYGDNKKKGQWRVAYQYKVLEADSTIDFMTDTDWGDGGTDRRGHAADVSYNILDWWQVRLGFFLTEKISNRPNAGHNMVGYDGADKLFRTQIDTSFKF